ncbi:MAG TPA: GNAT family protein [Steroidobacteraceae bacterium]|jgi:ribosomal-protein-alanine N-acetyltransferase|nr:GNAT family protein [Steroidobacteraceae bacterium]
MKSLIYLRQPGSEDRGPFLDAVRHSKSLHRPWVRAPATRREFDAYLKKMAEPANHAYLVCRRDTDAIVGVINLTNVILGALRSGYLGYYAFAGQERRGYMGAGLKAVTAQAFGTLKLHRLEANIQPENRASLALARNCGFRREGYSPRYLKIGGRWRDHERWAILAS